jgi:hypothetical protein
LPQRVFFHQDSQDALQMVLEVNHDHINERTTNSRCACQ